MGELVGGVHCYSCYVYIISGVIYGTCITVCLQDFAFPSLTEHEIEQTCEGQKNKLHSIIMCLSVHVKDGKLAIRKQGECHLNILSNECNKTKF